MCNPLQRAIERERERAGGSGRARTGMHCTRDKDVREMEKNRRRNMERVEKENGERENT